MVLPTQRNKPPTRGRGFLRLACHLRVLDLAQLNIAAAALELCILTTARTNEIIGMRKDEIDFRYGLYPVTA